MNKIKNSRKKIYFDLFENNKNIYKNEEILLLFNLNSKLFNNLKKSVQKFIGKTYNKINKKKLPINDVYKQKYLNKIVNLPNVTPNGAFYPKVENIEEYNKVIRRLIIILKELDIFNNIHLAATPTVRIVKGKVNKKLKSRPFATGKLHSDAWVGLKNDAIISIPILGDIKNTNVRFYSPKIVSKDFLKKIESFEMGKKLFKGKKYIGTLIKNKLSIFDHLCLHQTYRKNGGIRVSLDFAVAFKHKNSRLKKTNKNERFTYISKESFAKIGIKKKITTKYSIYQDINKIKNYKSSMPTKLIDV